MTLSVCNLMTGDPVDKALISIPECLIAHSRPPCTLVELGACKIPKCFVKSIPKGVPSQSDEFASCLRIKSMRSIVTNPIFFVTLKLSAIALLRNLTSMLKPTLTTYLPIRIFVIIIITEIKHYSYRNEGRRARKTWLF